MRGIVACALVAAALAGWARVAPAGEPPQPSPAPRHSAARSSKPAGSEAKTIVLRLQDRYRRTTSYTAHFIEDITSAGGTNRTRAGIVYFRKPGAMRWEFAAPDSELIVSNGETLYNYQPDLNQVIEVPLKQAFRSSAPTAFLLGVGDLEHDFGASLAPSTGKLTNLVLTPRAGGSQIEIELDPASYEIVTFKITDDLGNSTALRFDDIRSNLALDTSLFEFKPPPGADIVRPPLP